MNFVLMRCKRKLYQSTRIKDEKMALSSIDRIVNAPKLFPLNAKEIDQFIGGRVLQQRTTLGWSCDLLAKKIGVSSQQIQKYEHGRKRIYVKHLYELSKALSVPISFFYEGLK